MKQEVNEVLSRLQTLSNVEKVAFKEKKFGIKTSNALGVYMKDINIIAKEIKKNSPLGKALFDTGIYEAKLLCSKIFHPRDLNATLMEEWVKTFDNWEICDSFSMTLFARNKALALEKIPIWSSREETFEKRAAFATMAGLCSADKKSNNGVFESFLPFIKQASTDDRNFVKKAVSWALRSIGKRNVDLLDLAVKTAHQIAELDNAAAQWISKDVLKELTADKLRISDYPRDIYRPRP